MEKVVLHLKNGTLVKGFLVQFNEEADELRILTRKGYTERFYIDDLKAIFFVKTFEGKPKYRETKRYEEIEFKGKRIYIKFYDGESILGYLQGEFPWKKGFHLSVQNPHKKGFFIVPVDKQSNNKKIFVVISSVEDVALL
jgi:hypothetical protein